MYYRLKWYYRRLSVMGIEEIMHRVIEQISILWMLLNKGRLNYHQMANETSRVNHAFWHKTPMFSKMHWHKPETQLCLETKSWQFYQLHKNWKFRSEDAHLWSRDLVTDKIWPEIPFNKINYRTGNPWGDARMIWEPNRLQQLIDIALDEEFRSQSKRDEATEAQADRFIFYCDMLQHWITHNPYLIGINYVSAMECGLRIVSVLTSASRFQLQFRQAPNKQVLINYLVYSHASYISNRISSHSSSGNHTIAECTGLLLAALYFPEHRESKWWLKTALENLRAESNRQILPDGGSIEQTTWYLKFVVDLLTVCQVALNEFNISEPNIDQAIDRGKAFLEHFYQDNQMIEVGDSDSGFAVSPYFSNRMVSDPGVTAEPTTPVKNKPQLHVLSKSGYSVIDTGANKWIFDHGPLGMAPSHGHGHADALAIILYHQGQPCLIDTGTCTYNGDQNKRQYFRSTQAHNTIAIQGKDQAKQETNFMWSQPYESKLISAETDDQDICQIVATHNGYEDAGLKHCRKLFVAAEGWGLIVDELDANAQTDIEINWHCLNTVSNQPSKFQINGLLTCKTSYEAELIEGKNSQLLGQRSTAYETIAPCNVIHHRASIQYSHTLITLLIPMNRDLAQSITKAIETINDKYLTNTQKQLVYKLI